MRIRESINPRTVGVLVLATIVCISLGVGVATAQPVGDASGAIVIDADQTVEEIDSAAGVIVIHGTVTGDVSGFAGVIRISESGTVGGSVDGAAGAVMIDGSVEGDVDIGAGFFEIGSPAWIGGDLAVGAGTVRVDGTIAGTVRTGGDSIEIGPNADIGGEFRYDTDTFTQHPDAAIAGDVTHDPEVAEQTQNGFELPIPGWAGTLYWFGANLLLGVILLLGFKSFSSDAASRIVSDPLRTGGGGVATMIGLPIALVLVALTIIGVPITILGAGGFVALIWISSVYGKLAVGTWILGLVNRDNRWLALVVGIGAVAIFAAIPFIGTVLQIIVIALGLGAISIELWNTYQREDVARPTEPPRSAI